MVNLFVIILILAGAVVHRYLSIYEEAGMLPYSQGFKLFLVMYLLGSLINLVWIFGLALGIVLFLLLFLQFLYGSFLWVFLIPFVWKTIKSYETPKINIVAHASWSYIGIFLLVLGFANFFVSDYASLKNALVEQYDSQFLLGVGIAILIGGNIFQALTMKMMTKMSNGR